MIQFARGALVLASLVAGLIFARFWRDSRDRLFLNFACAFWLFALNWALLALVGAETESGHYFYVLRFLAFVLIILGIVRKNRGAVR
jgi:hypothetical protein